MGGGLELCWRTSRESHPSEDLSELPPLLVSVAGQEYHCVLTGIAVRQLATAVFGWMGTAGHLIGPSFITEMKFAAIHFLSQVVLAHPPHRFPLFRRTVRERIPVAGYDRHLAVFF